MTNTLPERLQDLLLGEAPTLTRQDLAEQTGMTVANAEMLWRLLGFPHVADNEAAFTAGDAAALQLAASLMQLGVLSPQSQAALVRTLARSFARLAEWQTSLLAEIGETAGEESYLALVEDVLPQIEALQNYIWRRHLASASAARLTTDDAAATGVELAVGFVDIVGYTSRSRKLDAAELIEWIERFESGVTGTVTDNGGHVIKTLGDGMLFTVSKPRTAAEIGLLLTAHSNDEQDGFPAVRVGIAYGNVIRRLGDVFGPTVNIAARLTSIGRPGTVIADRGIHDVLCAEHAPAATRADDLVLRRLPRINVKGYSKLESWRCAAPGGALPASSRSVTSWQQTEFTYYRVLYGPCTVR